MVGEGDELKDIGINLLSEDDSEGVRNLINSAYGAKKSKESIDWEFFQNPLNKKISPVFVGAKDGKGEVIGLYCHLPMQFAAKGKIIDCLYGCYRAVKKEHRRKGIYRMMFNESEKVIEKKFSKTPILSGFTTEKFFRTDQKISNVFQVNTQIGLKKISKPLTLIGAIRSLSIPSFGGKKFQNEKRKLEFYNGVEIAVEKIPDFQLNKNFWGISVKMDEDFIVWRFSEKRGENYFAVSLSDKGNTSAYAILKNDSWKWGIKHFDAVSSEELSCLLSLLEEMGRNEGCHLIEFEGLPSPIYENAFLEGGYLVRKSNKYFQAYISEEVRRGFPKKFFNERGSWMLTSAALLSE